MHFVARKRLSFAYFDVTAFAGRVIGSRKFITIRSGHSFNLQALLGAVVFKMAQAIH